MDKCRKCYHPACVKLDRVPTGTWHCPYHHCITCGVEPMEDVIKKRFCAHCPTAYCATHMPRDFPRKAKQFGLIEFACETCLSKEAQTNSGGTEGGRMAFLRRVLQVLNKEGRPLSKMPQIGTKDLDLYVFYREVTKHGGIHKVLHEVGWDQIKKSLGVANAIQNVPGILKKFYVDLLYAHTPTTRTHILSHTYTITHTHTHIHPHAITHTLTHTHITHTYKHTHTQT